MTARTSLRQGPPQTLVPPRTTAVSLQGGLGAHMEEAVRRVTPRGNFSSPRDYMKAELVIFPSPRVYKENANDITRSCVIKVGGRNTLGLMEEFVFFGISSKQRGLQKN